MRLSILAAVGFSLVVLLAATVPTPSRHLGTVNATSGASSNNFAAGSTLPDGGSGAFTLAGTPQTPQALLVQCDTDSRIALGSGAGTAASNSPPNLGVKLGADQLFPVDLTGTAVAAIPASGSGDAHCAIYSRIR